MSVNSLNYSVNRHTISPLAVSPKDVDTVVGKMMGEDIPKDVLVRSEATLVSDKRELVTDLMVDSIKQRCHGKKATYVSTPITGGDRLFQFLEKHGVKSKKELDPATKADYAKEVIQANCEHAAGVNKEHRAAGETCLEVSSIAMPEWNQINYNEHWTEVVRDAPLEKVLVCDGWQLSYGCLLEVRNALDKGIPVTDEDGKIYDKNAAIQFVSDSKRSLESKGFQLGLLTQALTEPLSSLPMELH